MSSTTRRPIFGTLGRAVALALVLGTAACGRSGAVETAVVVPPPAADEPANGVTSEKAVLAGGCFWGVQGVFQHVKGVTEAVSGYTGGAASTARYESVGLGDTGHAESVQVTFDPRVISYGEILRIHFSVAHDPTEKNRQGPDVGTQYRSTIFPLDASQEKVAQAYIAQLDAAKTFGEPLATTVEPGRTFYRAEDYHQDFLAHNPSYPYIAINDLPKIDNLRKAFPDRFNSEPVLTQSAVAVSVR
ncbi:MAG: peptide-methionine (S)-S-oxide reductase MsrA [Rhodanobacteraceae bacterium]